MENDRDTNVPPEIIDLPGNTSSVKEQKPHHRNRLFWPVILILAGIFLLLQNLDVITAHINWWAGFIFIPVVGSLTAAVNAFQKSHKFDAIVRGSLGGAIVVGTVATMLLFDADWSRWWPLMIIAPGCSMLLGGSSEEESQKHRTHAYWSGLGMWFGFAVILLGVGFLVKMLPITLLEPYLAGYRWWAVPILFAGVGAFISALLVCIQNSFRPNWTVWFFSAIGVAITATGLFAIFNLNWNLLSPVILIAVGIVVMSGILIKK